VDRQPVVADTDALIDLAEGAGAHEAVKALLRAGRLATTAVSVFELWRGCETAARDLLRGIRVYPVTTASAMRAAELWRELEEKGGRVGERDTLIAGVCLATRLAVLTANVKHFRRVPGLRVVAAR
jgi:predicted nucleic acid-binding protein